MRLLRPLFLLLLPSVALSDPFDDFRIPEHRVFDWTGSLSGSASHQRRQLGDDFQVQAGSLQGSIATTASWLYDSDPRLTSFTVDVRASGVRNGEDVSSPLVTDQFRYRSTTEQWAMTLTDRRYPWDVPLGLEFRVATSGTYLQNWSNTRELRTLTFFPPTTEDSRVSAQQEEYDYRVLGAGTLGAGRVRDATAVYDVWVLEDRLRSRGVLRGPLSVATRERLAALIYNSSSYDFVLDRPGRRYWEDLIGILQRDDSFAETWDPVSALRVLEPYFGPDLSFTRFVSRSPIARQRGWFAGVASQALYSSQTMHFATSAFRQQTVNDTAQAPLVGEGASSAGHEETRIFVGPRAEWHRPLGLHWQADALTEQMFDTRGDGRMTSITGAWLNWIVTDRWLATANASHQVTLTRESTGTFANAGWAVVLGGDLSWFLEDHLLLGVSANASQSAQPDRFDRAYHASLSLGYRFAGRIQNPGITNPIRVP